MGINVNVSKPVDLNSNEYLKQFVAKAHISPDNNEFYEKFFQFTIKTAISSDEQLSLDSRLESFLESFIQNNLTSGNLGSLITVFLRKASEELLTLSDTQSHVHIYKIYNAVYVLRVLIKYILEIGGEFLLLQHFEALPRQLETNGATHEVSVTVEKTPATKIIDGTKFDAFLETIFNIICVIPLKDYTYHLQLECVNVILVLCSVYLHNQQTTERSTIFRTIYKCQYSSTLIATLLHFVAKMIPEPTSGPYGHASTSGSFVFGLAESFWSMLTFSKKSTESDELPKSFKENYPLANQSLLLILILTNHNADDTATDNVMNPYRYSLFNCTNSTETVKDDEISSFKIDYSGIYQTICKITHLDQTTLLLYLLLHRNEKFYRFVISQRISLQELVVPILEILYNKTAVNSSSHHIYMSLIVLLILSEDDGFNKSVHQIMLKNIQWYTERSISEISLGGLLILVIIRTIQYNMLKVRDKYLHTNCLACLANMSSQFRYLHPYVSQRLISLFETLAKKYSRLQTQLEDVKKSEATVVEVEDVIQDLSVLEEVLRMVLEIINSCLSHQLVYCPNLVYTLLYKRNVFECFRSNPAFQDIIQNIEMVIGFFTSRLQRVQDQRGELGVAEVYEVISKGSSQWSSDRLKKFADLRFKYVDEEGNEKSYFLPYIYFLLSENSIVSFPEGKKLFADI